MNDFFNGDPGDPIVFFGLTHILLLIGLIASIVLLWYLSPKIKNSKYEKWFRFALIAMVFLFEWKVFESRMLNSSLFRMPLCAVAIYSLTYAVGFKNEKVFKVVYFYAFGSLLSFLFYDIPWGLDRWGAWTFFGAHATIAWMAVYGITVLGFIPKRKDLYISIGVLAIYCLISGFATAKYGGSDEMFLLTPPLAELNSLVDISQVLYTALFCLFGALLMFIMYLLTLPRIRKRKD